MKFAIGILILGSVGLGYGERTSADYGIAVEGLDNGGDRVASANYGADVHAGSSLGGVASSASYGNKMGYTGQLYDVASVTVEATPEMISEGATTQLDGQVTLDDGTFLALGMSDFSWSVANPLSPVQGVDGNGLVTSEVVYEDTTVTLEGGYAGVVGEVMVEILNVSSDDYQSYAGDGLDDGWQVGNFGAPPNGSAGPSENPDGDPASNEFEFLAGTDPNDGTDFFRLTILSAGGGTADLELSKVIPERIYTVWAGTDLMVFAEEVTSFSVVAEGSEHPVTDAGAADLEKFYRVEIEEAP